VFHFIGKRTDFSDTVPLFCGTLNLGPRKPVLDSKVVHVGFVVDLWHFTRLYFENFVFSCQ
jgi:hypothetical protein